MFLFIRSFENNLLSVSASLKAVTRIRHQIKLPDDIAVGGSCYAYVFFQLKRLFFILSFVIFLCLWTEVRLMSLNMVTRITSNLLWINYCALRNNKKNHKYKHLAGSYSTVRGSYYEYVFRSIKPSLRSPAR